MQLQKSTSTTNHTFTHIHIFCRNNLLVNLSVLWCKRSKKEIMQMIVDNRGDSDDSDDSNH